MYKFLNIFFVFIFLITHTHQSFAVQKVNPMASLELIRNISVNSKTFKEFAENLIKFLPPTHKTYFEARLSEADQVKKYSVKIVSNVLYFKINNKEITLSPKNPSKGMYFVNGKSVRIDLTLATQDIINKIEEVLNQKKTSLFKFVIPNAEAVALIGLFWYGLLILGSAAGSYWGYNCEDLNNYCFKGIQDTFSSFEYFITHFKGHLKDADPQCNNEGSSSDIKSFAMELNSKTSKSIRVIKENNGYRVDLPNHTTGNNQPMALVFRDKYELENKQKVNFISLESGKEVPYDISIDKDRDKVGQILGMDNFKTNELLSSTQKLGSIIQAAEFCCSGKQLNKDSDCSVYRKAVRDYNGDLKPAELFEKHNN